MGLLGVAVSGTSFGLSKSFWVMVLTRSLKFVFSIFTSFFPRLWLTYLLFLTVVYSAGTSLLSRLA